MEENNLVVKDVDFYGDELTALKDNDGIVWTGVNSFCRGIGLSKSQRDTQIQNIQSDEVLKRGCLKFQAGVFDKNNEALALQLDYIPLWLAKISITPSMKAKHPELVDKLVNYQLKAKDVLAAAFLPEPKAPKPHSVKPLTITSRDICAIIGRHTKSHNITLREIRDCIEELEGLGLDRQDFFIDSSYRGANNNEKPYPQFLCTRKGCEYYANKLQHRKEFLSEVNARFDQMQDIIDGKPIHLEREPDTDRGASVGLYSSNDRGVLIVENDVYLLDEKQKDMFSALIPELLFRNVCQIKEVISSLLESVEKVEKMEAIFETKIENPNADEESQKMLPGNPETSNKEIEVPLDQVAILNKKQAKARYGIGEQYLIEIADEIGATVRVGRRRFFERKKMDAYFERIAE